MSTPNDIKEYLQQLREALAGADPALIQDALYDAEEHLRAELAERPGSNEADVLQLVAGSYGAPDEVASIYREQEIITQRALRMPLPRVRRSKLGRFFGVAADGHTWGALFYMLLALGTGFAYFVLAVGGVVLSAGLSLFIIGVPLVVMFVGMVRIMSLVEGRIVETMLGVRMPRRPLYAVRKMRLVKRISAMFTDLRTWTALMYMMLMLPLGIAYFSLATGLLGASLIAIASPLIMLPSALGLGDLYVSGQVMVDWGFGAHAIGWGDVTALVPFGILLLFATLHFVRGVGRLHGHLAKHLLVRCTLD